MSQNSTGDGNSTDNVRVVIGMTFEIPIAVLAVFGNLLVCWAVYYNNRLHNITNYFVVSLAIADMLVGLFAIPFALLVNVERPQNMFHLCLFMNSFVVFLTQTSIFSLVTIAMDRYFAVTKPLKYRRVATGRRTTIIIVITWIVAFFIGMAPLFGWNKGKPVNNKCIFTEVIDMKYMVYFNFFGCVIPPLLVMLFVYIRIFQEVHKQVLAISQTVVGTEDETSSRLAALSLKEARAAKLLSIVIIIFAVCWLPLHIINTLAVVFNVDVSYNILLIAIILSHANSAMNPFIYAFNNKEYRRTFRKLILRFTLCNLLQNIGCSVSSKDEDSKQSTYPPLFTRNGVKSATTVTPTTTPPLCTPILMRKLHSDRARVSPHCALLEESRLGNSTSNV